MTRSLRHSCGHRVEQRLDPPASGFVFFDADALSPKPITHCPNCRQDLVAALLDGHLSEPGRASAATDQKPLF